MELEVEKLSGIQAIKGLIGEKKIKPVFFRTNFGIHTFFMKETIDVIILDNKNEVKRLKINLSPNKIFLWKPIYDKVIELPAGYVKKLNISLGTKLRLKFI